MEPSPPFPHLRREDLEGRVAAESPGESEACAELVWWFWWRMCAPERHIPAVNVPGIGDQDTRKRTRFPTTEARAAVPRTRGVGLTSGAEPRAPRQRKFPDRPLLPACFPDTAPRTRCPVPAPSPRHHLRRRQDQGSGGAKGHPPRSRAFAQAGSEEDLHRAGRSRTEIGEAEPELPVEMLRAGHDSRLPGAPLSLRRPLSPNCSPLDTPKPRR